MDTLLQLAGEIGFSHAGALDAASLKALPEVRDMCAADRCRRYGRSWSCPPACGSLEACAARLASYHSGILVQTTVTLEDQFDMEGIRRTQERHKEMFHTLARQSRALYPDCLPLTAGTCTLCKSCTYPDRPCRYPTKRLSSMEAYGLLVSDVCKESGLPYYYGPGTLTFTSCILLKEGSIP
ncbi:MAG: DUF2284 domain-containing protein [Oscillospiraceae bacterium]|nr:DUF2284 domain-containing protein [Oscillospiraceae bacterium]